MSQEFCRFCLKTFDLRPIFVDISDNVCYSEILEITTGLKITLNDGFPQSTCSECLENINSNFKFRDQCRKSEAELSRIGFTKISDDIEVYQGDEIETGEYSKREFAGKGDYSKGEFEEKGKGEYLKNEVLEKSEYITSVFVQKAEYFSKQYEEKQWKTIEVPMIEINVDLQRLTQDHLVDHSSFSTAEEKYIQSETNEAKEVSSEINEAKEVSSEIDLAKEVSSEPKEAKVKSKKRVKREELLSLVDGNFKKNTPIKCKICKKILKSWPSFVSHAKLHLGFKFVCEFCGKSFISSTQLKRHCRSHHGMEKSLRCNLCEYMALDNRQLSLHVRRVHTGVRPYTCDICGNSYFSRQYLIGHLETHQQRVNVQCNICGGLYKSSRHLSRHTYVVHTRKLYKYRCTICAKEYASPKYARLHINSLHGRPPNKGDIERIPV